MKNGIILIIGVILVIGSVVLGYLYVQQSGKLNNAQSQIAALKSDVASLKVSAANPQSTPSSVNTSTTSVVSSVPIVPVPTPGAVSQAPVNPVTDVIQKLAPEVVRIDVAGSNFSASGSGFIIDSRGYIMTNQHVIDSASSINVTLMNGQQYSAAVTSSDVNLDLAILKLSGTISNLTTVILGSASDIVLGEDVIAAGFPLGTDLPGPVSFTKGIISASRTMDNSRYIQTDVTINPGSSGGCLVALNGKVIGITSDGVVPRGIDAENVGLAIPVDVFQPYIQANLKN